MANVSTAISAMVNTFGNLIDMLEVYVDMLVAFKGMVASIADETFNPSLFILGDVGNIEGQEVALGIERKEIAYRNVFSEPGIRDSITIRLNIISRADSDAKLRIDTDGFTADEITISPGSNDGISWNIAYAFQSSGSYEFNMSVYDSGGGGGVCLKTWRVIINNRVS